MRKFFADFSGKDWLFLALTIVGLILGLEAILNVRGKIRNWRASRSKLALEKRLRQLADYVATIKVFQEDSVRLLASAFEAIGTGIFALTFTALLCGPIFLLFYIFTDVRAGEHKLILTLVVLISSLMLWVGTDALSKFLKRVKYYRFPELLVTEITNLIIKARKNGYIASNESEIIKKLKDANIYPPYNFSDLDTLIGSGNTLEEFREVTANLKDTE